MSPPTEQLIRDYLNRLAIAARGRLSADERNALVTRTRDFIDRNAAVSGAATSMEVAALLARLGDPGVLVDQEVARLAAARGETAPPPPPSARGGRMGAAFRRRSSQASWHWPQAPGSQAMQARLLHGDQAGRAGGTSGTSGAGPLNGTSPASDAAKASGSGQPGQPESLNGKWPAAGRSDGGNGKAAGPLIWIPPQRRAETPPGHPSGPVNDIANDPASGRPSWPSVVARTTPAAAPTMPGATADAADGAGQPQAPRWSRRLLSGGAVLADRVWAWAKRYPIEAAAAMLLGLGGVIYPPIWLFGACVALASRQWDYRDKWIGLAGPVVLLVVGTALGVSLGIHHAGVSHDVHEGWVYGDILSRLGALLGAGYLVWRTAHARRKSTVPPWNKPRKVA